MFRDRIRRLEPPQEEEAPEERDEDEQEQFMCVKKKISLTKNTPLRRLAVEWLTYILQNQINVKL